MIAMLSLLQPPGTPLLPLWTHTILSSLFPPQLLTLLFFSAIRQRAGGQSILLVCLGLLYYAYLHHMHAPLRSLNEILWQGPRYLQLRMQRTLYGHLSISSQKVRTLTTAMKKISSHKLKYYNIAAKTRVLSTRKVCRASLPSISRKITPRPLLLSQPLKQLQRSN